MKRPTKNGATHNAKLTCRKKRRDKLAVPDELNAAFCGQVERLVLSLLHTLRRNSCARKYLRERRNIETAETKTPLKTEAPETQKPKAARKQERRNRENPNAAPEQERRATKTPTRNMSEEDESTNGDTPKPTTSTKQTQRQNTKLTRRQQRRTKLAVGDQIEWRCWRSGAAPCSGA